MKRRLPIGAFSRLTRLSIKALRHYDELGLLVPADVDPFTSYRYYGLHQVATAETIRRLRSIDVPLAQIAALVQESPGTHNLRDILLDQRTRLQSEVDRLNAAIAKAGSLLAAPDLDRNGEVDIGVERLGSATIAALSLTTSLGAAEADFQAGFGRLWDAIRAGGRQPSGAPWTVFHDLVGESADGHVELCVPIDGLIPVDGEVASYEVPEVDAAVALHVGPIDGIAPVYAAVLAWIDARPSMRIGGPPREVYLDDPTVADIALLRTRVAWPVVLEEEP
jgi:DNA-binding transcriptional MerR regulator